MMGELDKVHQSKREELAAVQAKLQEVQALVSRDEADLASLKDAEAVKDDWERRARECAEEVEEMQVRGSCGVADGVGYGAPVASGMVVRSWSGCCLWLRRQPRGERGELQCG